MIPTLARTDRVRTETEVALPNAAQSEYCGRFAPSPTGPLHFGSLVAAVGSYLQARVAGGRWLVRIEDLDPPREIPGAAASILRTLERCGFEWDAAVEYQSLRTELYVGALQHLDAGGLIYRCTCTRRALREQLGSASGELVYPGTCRTGPSSQDSASAALRLRTTPVAVSFIDELQGEFGQDLEREVGDYIVRRSDGQFAYQLAVVVDDQLQGITEVVRGVDLLDNTPRQIYLQRLLGYATPRYVHLPIAVNERGEKLSKQTGARPVDDLSAGPLLLRALEFLQQAPPRKLRTASCNDIWAWAIEHWHLEQLAGVVECPSDHEK